MPNSRKSWRRRLAAALLAAAVLSVSAIAWLGRGPDFAIQLERSLDSRRPMPELAKLLRHPSTWPDWYHMLFSVKTPGVLGIGDPVELVFRPKKMKSKEFTIHAEVLALDDRNLVLKFTSDSKGKIEKVVSDLVWRIGITEAGPQGQPQVTVRVEALTHGRRARVIARTFPRVILNQLLYADIYRLAGVEAREGFRITPRN